MRRREGKDLMLKCSMTFAAALLLGITGAATDRAEGVRLLKLTASKGHYLAPFARMMLSVAALRDGHPKEARTILTALAKQYPDNSLYERQLARIP